MYVYRCFYFIHGLGLTKLVMGEPGPLSPNEAQLLKMGNLILNGKKKETTKRND